MSKTKSYVGAGLVAGALCGLLGGGGGAVLVPLLMKFGGLSPQKALANSVSIILPLCTLSALLYWLRGDLNVSLALPYCIGGGLGGYLGGRFFPSLNTVWLQRGFAGLLLFAGIRGVFL